ncbi:MAG: nucleoside deaminase [Bacilli bacterium]
MKKEKIYKKLINNALKNVQQDEVPVSCIITDKDNHIISQSMNNRRKKYSVLGHAEINAIEKAEKKIKDWRLDGYYMYVSLKPCEMCQRIIEESRINHVFYLLDCQRTKKIIDNMTEINSIEYKKEYQQILSDFFKDKR